MSIGDANPVGSQLLVAMSVPAHVWGSAVAVEGLWNPVGMFDAGAVANAGPSDRVGRVRNVMFGN